MYNPASPGGAEWIELYNQMAVNMDLSGWRITGGVNFSFPEGTTIAAGGYLVVAGTAGAVPGAVGTWTGSLDNDGETIQLKNVSGRVMDELSFGDSGRWPVGADGSGATLSKRDPGSGGGLPEAWTASWQTGGTPSVRNFPDGLLLGPLQSLSGMGSGWIYQQGTDPGPNWAQTTYTAGAGGWLAGTGAFAFEDTPPPVSVGTVLADPATTANPVCYFQKSFAFSGNPGKTQLSAQILIDDGAVIYLNGYEIARQNMPAGPVTAATRALSAVGNAALATIPLPAQYLVAGTNVLSVSLHEAPVGGGFERVEEAGTMTAPANLALASTGALAFARDLLPGYPAIHNIPHLNDGLYGNSYSWINNSANSFCGISLGATPVTISSLAFGRSNVTSGDPCAGGVCTDRTDGTYTIQYTTAANPTAVTPDASWTTIATLVYAGPSSPLFSQPWRRHRYDFPALSATGLRLITSANGTCVDEIELYAARLPQPADLVFDFALNSQEILPLPTDTKIVINEISGAGDALFRIELKNEGQSPVSLAGMSLGAFGLPAATLNPGAFLVLNETQLGFRPLDGDRVFLYAAEGGTLLDAALVRPTVRARSGSRLLVPSAATFGAENSFALQQDIVINEVMYHFPPNSGTPFVPGVPAVTSSTEILPMSAAWRYNRSNLNLGATWAQSAHPEGGDWFSGQALLGFETTPASLPEALRTAFLTSNAPTYYFETEFTLTAGQLGTLAELQLQHIIDDGAAFYINGVEIPSIRYLLPAAPATFTFSTLATGSVSNGLLSTLKFIPPAGLNLQAGNNRLSIEVHNQTTAGNDMVCGARLYAVRNLSPAVPPVPAQPATPNPEEWIELHNKGAATVSLVGWKLAGAVKFNFPANTSIAPGQFLVMANNSAALKAKWPEMAARILGDFSGGLSNSGERIQLEDASGNPADEVSYHGSGWSDGGGSSLELRDPRSDNANPGAWADSEETGKSTWQTFTYRATGGQVFGPATWNEMRLGMLDAGECLIDDLSVRANPDGAATQLIQNGNFETLPAGSKWRLLGNHRTSVVIEEPGNPANHVLRLNASGPHETNHNHAESTFTPDALLSTSTTYEVSFRARWLAGSNQLNTRGYYQRLARTTELPIPTRLGTPGAANSRAIANAGPTISGLTHSPPVPAAGSPVTVSLAAADPDGVASATLHYRLDAAASFTSTPMTLDAGKWAAQIPGQAAGAIIQFYSEVLDAPGASSFGPAQGSDSRALVQWADGQAPALQAYQFRLIMLTADRDFLLANLNRLSNERRPGTLIYRGSEIFHDAGVRLQGTAAGRSRDGEEYPGYDIGFPPGHLFRGVHSSIGIDRSGRGPVVRQQDEIYVRQTFQRAGIPCPVDDLCYFISPYPAHTGTAILQLASYGGLWADSQFNEDGTVFNYDITYDPSSTSVPADRESLKPPVPFGHITTDMVNLGEDKEQYRGPFDIRAGKRRDDYRALITLCQTMALPEAQLAVQAPLVLDLDEVLRCTALVNLWGIGDTYYTGGLPHNIRLFTPDDGTGVNFLPWDMDFVMNGVTSAALLPAGVTNNLIRLINNIPGNKRLYLGHIRHLCNTAFKSSYLSPWLTHYGTVVGQNFGGAAGYIDARCASAATQYNASVPSVPYTITTNSGADFSVAAGEVVLDGTGWIDIHEIRRAGSADPLAITWPTISTWRATLPLVSGPNVIALEACDFDGVLISTKTITITNTLIEPSPRDFLRITELHYHPANPSTTAELSASAVDTDFEFIEFKNIGSQPLRLNGVHIATGLDFIVPNGSTLTGGQFAVIVRKRTAFEARFGMTATILGEYPTDALSNGGETVTVLDSTGAAIQSCTYNDAWFPSTDGPGWSMVVRDENASALDLNTAAAWAISFQMHGNPGGSNGPVFSTEYEGWRQQNFTAAELADPLLSGPGATRDGLSNQLRYALGLTPSQPGFAGLPTASLNGTQIDFSYRRLKKPLDLQYAPESSTDLRNWLPDSTPVSVTDNADGTETVTVRFTAGLRNYFRLRVTGP